MHVIAEPGLLSGSAGATNAATRERWPLVRTVCSFPSVCLLWLALLILLVSAKDIAEPDIWWHLQNARHLLDTHHFPSVDTYSFTAAGSPWLNHEWLSELAFYGGYRAWALSGLLAVYFGVLLLIYAGVYYLCCFAGADSSNAAVATLGAVILGEVSFGPRMLLFGWLCMTALLILLERFRQTGRGLWPLPVLFAVWINLHGSWVFGIIVLVLTIACGLVEGQWGLVVSRRGTASESRRLMIALATSLVALLLNPFGCRLVLYPFDLLFRQQTNLQHIDEWQSVNFAIGTGKLAFLAIVALLSAVLMFRRAWRLDKSLITLFALWAGLTHVRFLFFLGLVIAPVLAPYLKLLAPYDPASEKRVVNAGLIGCTLVAFAMLWPSQAKLQQRVDHDFPTAALDYMQHEHIRGRVFNNYTFGGYMIWKVPELKTFIDGRADLFVYNGFFDEHLHATLIEDSLAVLDKYHIDYALLEPKQPLTYLLQHSAGWKTLYRDKAAILLARGACGDSAPQ